MKYISLLFFLLGIVIITTTVNVSAQSLTSNSGDTNYYCPQLTMLLQRGARDGATGGQVSELQSFLADRYSLDESTVITGFFGRTTQTYVQQFQREEGLPAFGVVGAMTRARIAAVCARAERQACPVPQNIQCGAGEEYISGGRNAAGCALTGWCKPKTITSDFYAIPEEGYVPHTVTFYAMVGGRAQYAVDFGDGSGQQSIACFAPADACVSPGKIEHAYTKSGTYTATLKRVYRLMELQPGDRILGPLATINIKVKEKEIPVVKPDPRCKVWFDGCNTCSRARATDTFACTEIACSQSMRQNTQPLCREYFPVGKTDAPPSITAFSGPTQLDVNQDGIWRIEARDADGQQLSYTVDWGEYISGQSTSTTPINFSQAAFITHRFAQAGSYTVGITVYDTAGGSATSSAIVTVGSVVAACPSQARVCGERRVCTAQECWNEKRTYETICSLRAESAVFVSEGACSL